MAPGGERETDFAADECLFDLQTFDFQTFRLLDSSLLEEE
jgi:hypothetical protein